MSSSSFKVLHLKLCSVAYLMLACFRGGNIEIHWLGNSSLNSYCTVLCPCELWSYDCRKMNFRGLIYHRFQFKNPNNAQHHHLIYSTCGLEGRIYRIMKRAYHTGLLKLNIICFINLRLFCILLEEFPRNDLLSPITNLSPSQSCNPERVAHGVYEQQLRSLKRFISNISSRSWISNLRHYAWRSIYCS